MPRLPLEGVRVVDLTWIVAGPICTQVLADLGADVIKVEHERALDYVRNAPPFAGDRPGINRSGFFNNLNRNKRSVILNLASPKGREVLCSLIAISDVLVENFSPRVMRERWGLGYEALRAVRPDIIYCSLSGFGHTGPHRHYTTWGPTAQALSGLTYMSGLPGHEPAGWGFSYMDHTAGHYAVIAILMALHHRNRTGQGQWIDISQVETGIALNGTAILDYTVNGRASRPLGNRSDHPPAAPHGAYPCRGEDRWIAISVFTEEQWQALVRLMGDPPWALKPPFNSLRGRLAHQDLLDARISRWTAGWDAYELMHALQGAGVPAGVVQTARDQVEHDPQLRERGFFTTAEHPEIGAFPFVGLPVHLSLTPGSVRTPAPLLGQHTEEVLGDLLGVQDVWALAREGAL